MPVVQVRHPLVQHHLAQLRERSTPPAEFRRLVQRLAGLLAYEATQDLELEEIGIHTPLTSTTGQRLAPRIGLVPILRAGLGMVDPILDLIPVAEVWHLGLYRDEATARPVEYYSKLPDTRPVDVALVVDPMLATGGSALAALAALKRWGVPRLKVLSIIASQPGINAVVSEFPAAHIHVCAVDRELDARKFIVPGLGDAGDRTFNTLRGED
jgi:uracil phosphoribosyltransferase